MHKIKRILLNIVNEISFLYQKYHFVVPLTVWKGYIYTFKRRQIINKLSILNPTSKYDYNYWLKGKKEEHECIKFKYNPLISILIPVYNVKEEYLVECIESVLNQTYQNFEICLVDDASNNIRTIDCLKKYESNEKCKVYWRKENGNISKASNDALKISNGEYIALLDNDDLLTKDALYENVKLLNKRQDLDLIYSDEDKLDEDGRYISPHFKPDFSPDTLLSLNYICHFTLIRKKLLKEIGGFEIGVEGAQDYDVFLKITEKTNRIAHIPKILYHWRISKTSTASCLDAKFGIEEKTITVLNNALKRRGINGTAIKDSESDFYRISYNFYDQPKVSIIVNNDSNYKNLLKCLNSIYKKTNYGNYQVILVNNQVKDKNSNIKSKYPNLIILDNAQEHNQIYNYRYAINKSDGEVVVMLSSYAEITTDSWLRELIGYAMQTHIGMVGVKLVTDYNLIWHAGMLLGVNSLGCNAYFGGFNRQDGLYGRLRVPYNYSAVSFDFVAVERKKFDIIDDDVLCDVECNLCLLNKGYYNVVLPYIEIKYHKELKKSSFMEQNMVTSKYDLYAEHILHKYSQYINNDQFYNSNFSKCNTNAYFYLDKNEEKDNEN